MIEKKKNYTNLICITGISLCFLALFFMYKDHQKDLNTHTTVTGIIQDVDMNYVGGKRGRAVFVNALLKYKDGRLIEITNWSKKMKLHQDMTLKINGCDQIVSINGVDI